MTDTDIIYYQNTHYNSTNQPLDSNYVANLDNTFISNQSEYLVAVNKFKVSSLETVPLSRSNIPFRQWELGLKVGNVVATSYVAQPNEIVPDNQLYNYNITTNQIDIYLINGSALTLSNSVSIPVGISDVQQVLTDAELNFWISTPQTLYVVNKTGALLNSFIFQSIVYISIGPISQCFVCDSVQNAVSVCVLNSNNQIVITNTISTNFNNQPFTELSSASFDGDSLVISYEKNHWTVYNSNFTAISDNNNQSINTIKGSSVSTLNDKVYFLDLYEHTEPTILATIDIGNLESGALYIKNLQTDTLIFNIGSIHTGQFFAGNNIETFFGFNNEATSNSQTNLSNVNTSTEYNFIPYHFNISNELNLQTVVLNPFELASENLISLPALQICSDSLYNTVTFYMLNSDATSISVYQNGSSALVTTIPIAAIFQPNQQINLDIVGKICSDSKYGHFYYAYSVLDTNTQVSVVNIEMFGRTSVNTWVYANTFVTNDNQYDNATIDTLVVLSDINNYTMIAFLTKENNVDHFLQWSVSPFNTNPVSYGPAGSNNFITIANDTYIYRYSSNGELKVSTTDAFLNNLTVQNANISRFLGFDLSGYLLILNGNNEYQAITIANNTITVQYSFIPNEGSQWIATRQNIRDNNQTYPASICYSPLDQTILLGCTYTGQIVYWSGYSWILTEFAVPNAPTFCQISMDPSGYVWVCVKSPTYLVYQSTEPFLNINDPLLFNPTTITSNIDIVSITFDLHQPNVCYAVTDSVSGTGILYKGPYIPNISLSTHKTDQLYCNYVLITPYDDDSITTTNNNLYSVQLNDPSNFSAVALPESPISYGCVIDSINNELLVGDIYNNQVIQFSLANLSTIGNIPLTNISNIYSRSGNFIDQGKLDIYNLDTYITQLNLCFQNCYNKLILINPLISASPVPNFSLDYTTGKLTLNYDVQFAETNNNILINNNLLPYVKYKVSNNLVDGLNAIVLNASSALTQTSSTIWKLNQLDKLVLQTSLMLVSDITGTNSKSLNIFTEFDIDTSNPTFFNNDCSLLYSAILLRNYVLNSNTELRNIQYSFYYQYKDGERYKYFIPPNENLSIKLQFTRQY